MIVVISQVSGRPITKEPNVKTTIKPGEPGISSHDNWIMWLTYAVLIAVPLVFSRISYDQFDLIKMALFKVLVLGIAFVWSEKILTRRATISWSWREGLLAAFLLVAVISTVASIDVPTSVHGTYQRYQGLLTFITYITVYFVVAQTLKGKKRLHTLIEVISITGGIVALYGIFQFIGLDPFYWGDVLFEQRRSFSTFGNPDLLAGYLVLAFPCAIAAFLDKGKIAWLHGVSAFVLAAGLLTALTRGGWLGALVSVICTGILLGRRLKFYWKKVTILVAPVVIVAIGLAIFSSTGNLNIVSKLQGAFRLDSGTAMNRYQIWTDGWRMVKDRPFFGQGLDTYRLASGHFETRAYVRSVEGAAIPDNAHNYFVQLAAGGGPLAALLMYGFFIAWIVRMVQVRRRLADEGERLLLSGVIAAVIGYMATTLVDISIIGADSTFWILLAAATGFSVKFDPAYRSFDFSKLSLSIRRTVVAILLAVSLAGAGFAAAMFASDIFFVRGLTAAYAGDEALAVTYLNTAATLYPSHGQIMSELGQAYVRWWGAAILRKDNQGQAYFIQQAIKSFERASLAEPLEVDYRLSLADAYGYAGQTQQAVDTLSLALEQRPYSVPGNYRYGRFMEASGRKSEAIKSYKFVLSLAPSDEDALAGLVRMYTSLGNNAKAAEYQRRLDNIKAGG